MIPITPGGELVRQWTRDRIASEIASTGDAIRAALRCGDMEQAHTLISKKVGLRVCAGEIRVKLHRGPASDGPRPRKRF
ncbi:MAG TPA: hypothetical protein VNZ94_00470 [Xanthobacteraceae bacterium]|nr:hypothetical protein [Xanthobacteraceae bacterium]